ncbi:hypothetical protein SAMN02745945_01399 [Peptoclostridium litorale DSM 5388]|uniref:DUF2225 domain-containing protein n=1 Tax=Peptoclostridium litorale DSM 5388 TaxID=1121324 RepID=A0A069RET0_PEPLI|nr:DUF2225 domain-containing protein [Peptoclostridium litorale]KDR95549.1 hypothetical protein CLIT_10c02760 [Peptoclostridium litorale DSM 5388]SIN98061.1 hypothetical protein SAMN02745945_01399 [Peptoclostridium litorale DSM 5388]
MNRELEEFYDKEMTCPVCTFIFKTKKLRRSAIRVEKNDTDFCSYYKSENPYFYALAVCPQCGYVEFENIFEKISKISIEKILRNITMKWTPREYGGKRNLAQAIQIYKLSLYQSEVLGKEDSYKANVCLKLAWFYRYIGNMQSEMKFLEYACNLYSSAYSGENFPISGMDSARLAYLIGELCRKLGKYEEAIKWFNKAVNDPNMKKALHIKKMARDQWHLAAEEYKIQKSNQAGYSE